ALPSEVARLTVHVKEVARRWWRDRAGRQRDGRPRRRRLNTDPTVAREWAVIAVLLKRRLEDEKLPGRREGKLINIELPGQSVAPGAVAGHVQSRTPSLAERSTHRSDVRPSDQRCARRARNIDRPPLRVVSLDNRSAEVVTATLQCSGDHRARGRVKAFVGAA